MSVVLIADSHRLCRDALCDFIRHTKVPFEVEGVEDYKSLQRKTSERKADLVLIDAGLPGLPDDAAFAYKVGWMIVDGAAYRDGAAVRGVFPKTLSSKEFLAGIQDILAGKGFFPHYTAHAISDVGQPAREFHLSAREREVAGYLIQGASNKEIARALDLQVVTIKLHVRGVCRKLGAQNRTQAAMIAKEYKLA